jgi:hypothetical protein
MEIVVRLPGKYKSPLTKKEFTRADLDCIYVDFVAGMLLVDLFKKHNISRASFEYLMRDYYHRNVRLFVEAYDDIAEKRLGYKTQSYWTEEELLNPKEYTWENLSKKEKLFYEKYSRKIERERYYAKHSRND